MELSPGLFRRLGAADGVLMVTGALLEDATLPLGWRQELANLVDAMGAASGQAQGLPRAVTCSSKLRSSPTPQRVYLLRHPEHAGLVIGLLKVGPKQLFLLDANCRHVEVRPLCVLDFWVHAEHQRRGHGKRLLDIMLAREQAHAAQLAYDRPSRKFRALLAKHYGLQDHLPQVNHFVVFREFGLEALPSGREGRRASIGGGGTTTLPQLAARSDGMLVASGSSASHPSTSATEDPGPEARRPSYGRRNVLQRATYATVAAGGLPALPPPRGAESGHCLGSSLSSSISSISFSTPPTTPRQSERAPLSFPAIPTSALPSLPPAGRWAGTHYGADHLPPLHVSHSMKQARTMDLRHFNSSSRLY